MFKSRPAFVALIIGFTILLGTTLLSLIPIRVDILTLTPEKNAVIHKPTGTNVKNRINNIIIKIANPPVKNRSFILIKSSLQIFSILQLLLLLSYHFLL